MTAIISIDVFFDFICPWCLIGKRQLHMAIEKLKQSHPDVKVVLNWRGVQLLPHMPDQGMPFQAFYLQRLGSTTAVRMRQMQVRQAAKAVGIDLDFERIVRMPNTAKAHTLLFNALKIGSAEQNNRLLEGIFSAYFHHSENINDAYTLAKIAGYCGFQDSCVDEILTQPLFEFSSANTGGKGVPYFVFNGRFAMAGAQPATQLYQAMLETLMIQG